VSGDRPVPWFHVVHRDNFTFKCCYSVLYLSQIWNSWLGCADSSVIHSPLTFLRLRAVNGSSFELLYRSLQVTVRSFKATDFCVFVIFYWFRFLERITSTLCFEQPFLKFYILIVFVEHLFKFLLYLFLSLENHREEEPVLISVPFLAGARTVRYCALDVLRTGGDIDRRTQQMAQVFRVPMHLDLVSLSFIAIEYRSLPAYYGQLHGGWAALPDILDSPRYSGFILV